MRARALTAMLLLAGLGCSSDPAINASGTESETGSETTGESSSTGDPDTGWSECDGDCPDGWSCVDDECVPPDSWPCECANTEICVDEVCVVVELLPACEPLAISTTETFALGDGGELVIADFDTERPGAELVGVDMNQAITWADGAAQVSPLTYPIGSSLDVAALDTNADGRLDLAVAIPSVHILYQIVGDGLGGFANDVQRNFGGDPVREVARLRTGPGVEGLIVRVSPEDGFENWLFFDADTSVQPEQIIDEPLERWIADLDGDGVDELLVRRGLANTDIWRLEAGAYAPTVALPTSLEPLPGPGDCAGFGFGDLDGDGDIDLVCAASSYARVVGYTALVPFANDGAGVLTRGQPIVVASLGGSPQVFDLDGDQIPELLLRDAVVDLAADGSFVCAAGHELGVAEVGDLDGDGADELATLDGNGVAAIHELGW